MGLQLCERKPLTFEGRVPALACRTAAWRRGWPGPGGWWGNVGSAFWLGAAGSRAGDMLRREVEEGPSGPEFRRTSVPILTSSRDNHCLPTCSQVLSGFG